MVAWLGVPLKNFEWTDKPHTFESSKGVFRHFLDAAFEADHYSGGMHMRVLSKIHLTLNRHSTLITAVNFRG